MCLGSVIEVLRAYMDITELFRCPDIHTRKSTTACDGSTFGRQDRTTTSLAATRDSATSPRRFGSHLSRSF